MDSALDLLEKRSAIYSDRPCAAVAVDIMGWDTLTSLIPYGPIWRMHRRWFQGILNERHVTEKYQHIQIREAHRLAFQLLDSPGEIMKHIRRFSAYIVMDIAYGHTGSSKDDEFIAIAEEVMSAAVEAGTPAANLYNFIPILAYVPSWVPGAGVKRKFKHYRKLLQHLVDQSRRFVNHDKTIADGKPPLIVSLLDEAAKNEEDRARLEHHVLGAGVSLFGAILDTSSAVLSSFILAMVLHPEVARKAQREIDEVVGGARMPTFDDRKSLPYLECVMKEVYRWHPMLPLGVPHKLMVDDEYRGYHLPKAATVIPNVWAMSRNPAIFPDPDAFRPERYQDISIGNAVEADLRRMVFGFGRRLCPGRYLGDSNVWLIAATLLATFNFERLRDSTGREIIPAVKWGSDLINHPEPFEFNVRPRSEAAAKLVSQPANDLPDQ
ncbi:cytochrome P450 [Wolfiporia cocos MD-104 SS10]|uniref:Cytochrome P450 n=1 Tax=Wolfiporia cocos (strain MD-104) TaxID=742152 RepID=A0A2H3JAY2_WOLCO|nr:cytochrome P450 [Wolfiporia cocos MD-104 SS10]